MVAWLKKIVGLRELRKLAPLKPYEILVVHGRTTEAALSMANALGNAHGVSKDPFTILSVGDEVDVCTVRMLPDEVKEQLREALNG